MVMTPEDYVSCPTALALKKAGFDWPCDYYWYKVYTDSDKMEMRQASADDYNNDDWSVPHCSAPTLWQAQKWLRENCGIHIDAYPYTDTSTDADGQVCEEWQYWGADLIQVATGKRIAMPADNCDSYEQALSAGIAAALEPYAEPDTDSGKEVNFPTNEFRNLSQKTVICDKQFDNILKDRFSKERRLNIATQIMSAILSNQKMLNNLAHGEATAEGAVKCIVDATMMYTDSLIAECEKGGDHEKA